MGSGVLATQSNHGPDLAVDTRTTRRRPSQDGGGEGARRTASAHHETRPSSEALRTRPIVVPVPLMDFPEPAEDGDSYARWLAGQLHFDQLDLQAAVFNTTPSTVGWDIQARAIHCWGQAGR